MHPRNAPVKKVDAILRELGLPPEAVPEEDVVRLEPAKNAPGRTSCGKVGFQSKSKAMQARAHRLKTSANTSFLRVYFCDQCKHWHLTSSKRDY